SPGDYVFEVKGEASATAPVTSWRISVQAPFYARWWFLLLAGLTLAALIIAIILRRIAVIKKESGLQQRIAEAEVSALRAQMNPHFIFNCLSAIDNMIETDQKDKATKYLNRFGRLIRSVLDSSKKTLVPLENDIETLMLYLQLEKFRCDDRFTYQLTTDPELLNADYKVPPLLVQPYLENAIHHGLLNLENGTGQLQVSISLEGNILVYRIQDNGVGRAAAAQLEHRHEQEHTSYGMSITEERIRKFNKGALPDPVRITDLFNHGRAAGTLVEVFLQTA
ncbi:MAG TPA: histidine kinase, partial [Chitinophagaceae bacterium]|nr:histidine kinase [Chitinophagaceae bacterium]